MASRVHDCNMGKQNSNVGFSLQVDVPLGTHERGDAKLADLMRVRDGTVPSGPAARRAAYASTVKKPPGGTPSGTARGVPMSQSRRGTSGGDALYTGGLSRRESNPSSSRGPASGRSSGRSRRAEGLGVAGYSDSGGGDAKPDLDPAELMRLRALRDQMAAITEVLGPGSAAGRPFMPSLGAIGEKGAAMGPPRRTPKAAASPPPPQRTERPGDVAAGSSRGRAAAAVVKAPKSEARERERERKEVEKAAMVAQPDLPDAEMQRLASIRAQMAAMMAGLS